MKSFRAAVPSLLSLAFSACANGPLERPEAIEIAERLPHLQRSVALRLDASGAEPYGSREEWEATFARVFEELDVCAALLPLDREADADLAIGIAIRPSPPAEPEVEGRGAFLDFLAWSTVPLLPLWIPDVNLSPGLTIEVAGGGRELGVGKASQVSTCYLERYPFLSWSTLGAVFVPPFIFKSGDAEHSAAAMAETVRLDAAVQAAGMVKRFSLGAAELIAELAVGDDLTLTYTPLAGVRMVRAWIEPAVPTKSSARPDIVGRDWPPGQRRTVPLPALETHDGPAPRLIRVEAIGKSGPPVRYTVCVPGAREPAQGKAES